MNDAIKQPSSHHARMRKVRVDLRIESELKDRFVEKCRNLKPRPVSPSEMIRVLITLWTDEETK
jgi:hypothetical protein